MACRVRRGGRSFVLCAATTALAACGGGGGPAGPSLSVSPRQIQVHATTSDAAPTAEIDLTVTNAPSTGLYVNARLSKNGISDVTLGATTSNTAVIDVAFQSPAALGPGAYVDTVEISVCTDSQCTNQIANSPQSVSVTYTVTAAPLAISQLAPSSAAAGTAGLVLWVYGSGLLSSSVVEWGGSPLPTTFVSGTVLTADVPSSSLAAPGTASVTVSNAASGGGVSNALTFTVTSTTPTLASLTPGSVLAGSAAFVLTLDGTGFDVSSVVLWNGNSRPTTYVSGTRLTAQIVADDVASAGNASVAVTNAADGGGVSNALTLAVSPPTALSLTSLRPSIVTAGGPAFALTAIGTGFPIGAAVQFDGAARPTTYLSPNQLSAQIDAADIAAAGTASITVLAQGITSGALTLTISPPASDAVALQMTPAHSGAVSMAPVAFPATSAWTVDLGGSPSYPLIAAGKVIVTVAISGSTQLVALDQATGAIAWGPIPIAGSANAAYDGGTVYVLSANNGPALVGAYDVTTGVQRWSALLTGQYSFSSPPTALNGIVYGAGAGVGGTLYALDGSTGAQLWTQSVENGDSSSPAVTADGVYVVYPYQTYDFDPVTGVPVWHDDAGGEGGGGATPVVANGLLYAPNGFGTYDGTVFDAEEGTLLRSYVADNLPAFGPGVGYFLQAGTLRGVALANNTVLWSFAGDGSLVTSPIAVNQYVVVGSSLGKLYGLDGTTGSVVWTFDLGAPLPTGAGWGARMPLSGLAAGNGLLVVPAGTRVTAFTLAGH